MVEQDSGFFGGLVAQQQVQVRHFAYGGSTMPDSIAWLRLSFLVELTLMGHLSGFGPLGLGSLPTVAHI